MKDFAFIRFLPDFEKAKQIDDPKISLPSLRRKNQIIIHPKGIYTQITNVPDGIAFDDDFKAEVIDSCGVIISNVTNRIAITEFTHDDNGTQQIAFEIYQLGLESGLAPRYFKFSKTTGDDVWYSNAFVCSADYESETTTVQYNCIDTFDGISYLNSGIIQRISLLGVSERAIDDEGEGSVYIPLEGGEYGARMIRNEKTGYRFQYSNKFTYQRLKSVLMSDVIYLDDIRMMNKIVLKGGEYISRSNMFESVFDVTLDDNDTRDLGLQIFSGFELIEKSPFGLYTLSNIPTEIVGTFNRNITIGTGTLTVYDASDDSVVQSFNQSDISVLDGTFTITGLNITDNGSYYILFDTGLFLSQFGETFALNNIDDWAFIVVDGDYDENDYEFDDYLTVGGVTPPTLRTVDDTVDLTVM